MQDQATHAAALAAILAQGERMTALPFTLAALPGGTVKEAAHTLASELACDLGERSMRPRTARKAADSWPVFLGRFYTRETWRGIPGPWPVKAGLFVLAVAEPGPFGEMALAAFGKWNGRRMARKAASQ